MNNKHISKRFLCVRHENAAGGRYMLLDSLWECMIWDFLCLVQFPVVLKRQSCCLIFSHAGCLPLAPSRGWGCRFKKDWCFFRKHTECMCACVTQRGSGGRGAVHGTTGPPLAWELLRHAMQPQECCSMLAYLTGSPSSHTYTHTHAHPTCNTKPSWQVQSPPGQQHLGDACK